jgi:hypothetical protein
MEKKMPNDEAKRNSQAQNQLLDLTAAIQPRQTSLNPLDRLRRAHIKSISHFEKTIDITDKQVFRGIPPRHYWLRSPRYVDIRRMSRPWQTSYFANSISQLPPDLREAYCMQRSLKAETRSLNTIEALKRSNE